MNYSWYIDYNKDVHFFAKNTELAPFNLATDTGMFIWDSLKLTEDLTQIRNKVTVIGGEYEANNRTETYVADGEQKQFPLAYKFSKAPAVTVNAVAKTVGVDGLDTVTNEDAYDCFWSFNEKYIRFKDSNYPDAADVVAITGSPLLPVVVNVPDQTSIS